MAPNGIELGGRQPVARHRRRVVEPERAPTERATDAHEAWGTRFVAPELPIADPVTARADQPLDRVGQLGAFASVMIIDEPPDGFELVAEPSPLALRPACAVKLSVGNTRDGDHRTEHGKREGEDRSGHCPHAHRDRDGRENREDGNRGGPGRLRRPRQRDPGRVVARVIGHAHRKAPPSWRRCRRHDDRDAASWHA